MFSPSYSPICISSTSPDNTPTTPSPPSPPSSETETCEYDPMSLHLSQSRSSFLASVPDEPSSSSTASDITDCPSSPLRPSQRTVTFRSLRRRPRRRPRRRALRSPDSRPRPRPSPTVYPRAYSPVPSPNINSTVTSSGQLEELRRTNNEILRAALVQWARLNVAGPVRSLNINIQVEQ